MALTTVPTVTTMTTAEIFSVCPSGFELLANNGIGCVKFSNVTSSKRDAEQSCRKSGNAILVEPRTIFDQKSLEKFAKMKNISVNNLFLGMGFVGGAWRWANNDYVSTGLYDLTEKLEYDLTENNNCDFTEKVEIRFN